MPTQVTNYQCPACTGPLHYSAKSGKLECDYCGSSFDVAEIEALYARKEAEAAAAKQAADAKAEAAQAAKAEAAEAAAASGGWDTSDLSRDWGAEADGLRVYSCPSCGAELICDQSTAATACPYCGNPAIVPGQFSGALRPDYILPFRLSKDDAVQALRSHCAAGRALCSRHFGGGGCCRELAAESVEIAALCRHNLACFAHWRGQCSGLVRHLQHGAGLDPVDVALDEGVRVGAHQCHQHLVQRHAGRAVGVGQAARRVTCLHGNAISRRGARAGHWRAARCTRCRGRGDSWCDRRRTLLALRAHHGG